MIRAVHLVPGGCRRAARWIPLKRRNSTLRTVAMIGTQHLSRCEGVTSSSMLPYFHVDLQHFCRNLSVDLAGVALARRWLYEL